MNDDSLLARIDRHGPALVAIAMALVSAAYLVDAYLASSRLHNLILLVPLVGFVILLAIGVTIAHFRGGGRDETVEDDDALAEQGGSSLSAAHIAALMASLVLYACLAPYIGFDLASAIFIAACLVIQGERRWVFVSVYSVLFAAAITWSLVHVAGAAVPTLLI